MKEACCRTVFDLGKAENRLKTSVRSVENVRSQDNQIAQISEQRSGHATDPTQQSRQVLGIDYRAAI